MARVQTRKSGNIIDGDKGGNPMVDRDVTYKFADNVPTSKRASQTKKAKGFAAVSGKFKTRSRNTNSSRTR